MDKDKLYRTRHPERCREIQKRYYEAHKEEISRKKREWYQENKDSIVRVRKPLERVQCDLCGLTFVKQYLQKHVDTRHMNPRHLRSSDEKKNVCVVIEKDEGPTSLCQTHDHSNEEEVRTAERTLESGDDER